MRPAHGRAQYTSIFDLHFLSTGTLLQFIVRKWLSVYKIQLIPSCTLVQFIPKISATKFKVAARSTEHMRQKVCNSQSFDQMTCNSRHNIMSQKKCLSFCSEINCLRASYKSYIPHCHHHHADWLHVIFKQIAYRCSKNDVAVNQKQETKAFLGWFS